MVRDDRLYLCDDKGRVHCWHAIGMIPRPGDPGYAPEYVFVGDELPLEKYFSGTMPSQKPGDWWEDDAEGDSAV